MASLRGNIWDIHNSPAKDEKIARALENKSNGWHIVQLLVTGQGFVGEGGGQNLLNVYLLTPFLKEPLVRVGVGPSTNWTLQSV